MVLEGVDHYRVMEAWFEAVRVVLTYRGEEYSPAYLQGISGAAFRIAGPCPCAPTCGHAMETQELAELLGYETEYVPLWGEDVDAETEVQDVLARIKDEIRAGRPALVWHAFTVCEWDVVCGFDKETHELVGQGSYAGKEDYARAEETRMIKCRDICPALGAIFIGEKTGRFDAREAELAALERAVRHARTPRDRFLVELAGRPMDWRFRDGLACYEWWINRFRVEPDRLPDNGTRYPLGVYRSTHRAASEFMKELAAKYPEAAAPLGQAAAHFGTEADALDECFELLFPNWELPKEPDAERNARAADLLTDARNAYASATDDILAALAVIEPARAQSARARATIRREDNAARIEGVPALGRNQGKDCTFAGALQAAMAVTERPYRYGDLMGLSGLAFRVRWCNEETATKWCHSAAIGEMPDEHAALARLTGWQLPTDVQFGQENPDREAIREKVVASIDAGRPVVAYLDDLDMAVIYGYEDGGNVLLVLDYKEGEETARLPIGELGPMQTYLADYTEPPPLRECLLEALQTAVRNWRRERHDGGIGGREYWYGDAAFAAWIRDLQAYDTFDDETKQALRVLDPWVCVSLWDAHRVATSFLNQWRCVLEEDARLALGRAAEMYEQEKGLLRPLARKKRGAREEQDWSEQARLDEVQILLKARELEAQAIAEIEKALAAEGVEVQAARD